MNGDSRSDGPGAATIAFLDEKAGAEEALRAVVAVDAEHSTWQFSDVPLDSGTFGELVSRGIVVKDDGAYRLADRSAVEAVLDNDAPPATEPTESSRSLSLPTIDRSVVAGLFGALVLVAAARMTTISSVFQRGYWLSPANDPYYFRYWLEQLLASSSGLTDFGVLVDAPGGVAGRRPLSHATNWFVAELLGGSQWAADMVAIWVPVLGSVLLGVLLYLLAVVLTNDARVGIASVLVFAVTPVHTVYTGIGFLDHNVHQYFWLGVTLLSLGWLAVDLTERLATMERPATAVAAHLRERNTWIAAGAFGLSVALGTHAWGGSPLLLIPLTAYIALRMTMDVRADVEPLRANLPLIAGLAVGSILSIVLHVSWGWHSTFVALTPALVAVGAVGVAAVGELWRRYDLPIRGLLVADGVIAGVGLLLFRIVRPADWAAARGRVDDLLFRDGATETASLYSPDFQVVFGPLYQLGMEFYIALAVLLWVWYVVVRRYEPGWLLIGTYSSYLLVLAGVQVRFAGQLALPMAILGGLGVVYVLSALEVTRRPALFASETTPEAVAVARPARLDPPIMRPETKKIAAIAAVGVLIFGLSLIYVPGLNAQTTYSEAQVDALAEIDAHATAHDKSFPENYVFNEWGENRMYNHFVNGESAGYGYAQSNFRTFQTGDDPDSWYEEFEDRVGYVVVAETDTELPAETTQRQLLDGLGAGAESGEPLVHYQLLYVDADRTAAAFVVVPGATITTSGSPGDEIIVSTDVEVTNTTFTYEREATVDENGDLSVTVPYAGVYEVGDETVTVSDETVLEGETVSVESA